MEQLTANVYVETQRHGANHGFVTTSAGIVLIDTPFKPSDTLQLKAEIESHGRLQYVLNTEPHWDLWTRNRFLDVPAVAHEGVRQRMIDMDVDKHRARIDRFGPGELDLFAALRRHVGRILRLQPPEAWQRTAVHSESGVVNLRQLMFQAVRHLRHHLPFIAEKRAAMSAH